MEVVKDFTLLPSESNEILLSKNPNRFVVFPIVYDDIWNFYKKQVASFWTPEEIDLSTDAKDFKSMTDDEQHFIKHVLAFFAASDGIVLENLGRRFLNEVQLTEAKMAYTFQLAMEGVHAETYSLLIDTIVKDEEEKRKVFEATSNFPAIKCKANWALKWVSDSDASFAQRLVAFACVEGIFFSGSFCSIFWLKKRNLMHGLTFSNELISRDEGIHVEFAALLYAKLENKLPEDTVHNIIKDAMQVEKTFILESLPVRLIGMNADLMSQYLEYVADVVCGLLGVAKIYNSPNPFSFMEMVSLQGKTNFFEKRVSDYSKAGVMSKRIEDKNVTFTLDVDF